MMSTYSWADAAAGDVPETDDELYALLDRTPTKVDRESPTEDVAAWTYATDLGEVEVEIIGAWVWLTFSGKPSDEVRTMLKDAGFRWAKNRGQWCHNCGVKARRARSYHPRDKYGSTRIKDTRDDE